MRHTAEFVCHSSPIVPRPLGKALDVSVDEELCIFVVVFLVMSCCCWGVGRGSSVIDNVFVVLSFFHFQFVGVHRSNKPCIIVLQIITLSGLRSFIFHIKSSSHLLAGLPALFWVFVDMIILEFHSAAFLVHPSGFWVANRRACHHFSFFCVSIQFVMLYVSILSSASFVLHFMYSIQSSRSSSWLADHHRMKYCCLVRIHHVWNLLLEYPRFFRQHECLLLQVLFAFVFSLSG